MSWRRLFLVFIFTISLAHAQTAPVPEHPPAAAVSDAAQSLAAARRILLKTVQFSALVFLPGFALCAFAISRGIRGTIKLGMVMLAGIAIPGYLLFWVYLASARVGLGISRALPFAFAGLFLIQLFKFTASQRRHLTRLLIPAALTLSASIGTLSLGYEYGGMEAPVVTAGNRFSHPLPEDNNIPFLFAEGVLRGSVPRPLAGDWLSSDRPPLQTEMILALEPFMRRYPELWYHIVSVVLQNLWIFALWLLLKAFRCSELTIAVVVVTCYLSGPAIVNSFFVWPKLLAAAYMLAVAVPILTARPQPGRGSWTLRAVMACLLALGLLAHGGSVFALLGILLFMLLRHRKGVVKETCLVGAIALLLYSPWIAYQKLIDPPGDRLLKFHLAGVEQVTAEPALKTIYDTYRAQTFSQWVAAKEENTLALFGHEVEYLKQIPFSMTRQGKWQIRILEFFYYVPALSLTIFGIAGLLLPRRFVPSPGEKRAATRLLVCCLCIIIPYILVMFKSSSMTLHQGTYVLVFMAMAGSILSLRAVAPRLAAAVCILQCAFTLLIYEPRIQSADTPIGLIPFRNGWMLSLYVVSLCAFLALLRVQSISRLRPQSR